MPDYLREARKAKREGDYSKAGDLFYLAGDEKHAVQMYLKGGHHALAARLLEKKGEWQTAAKLYVQSGKFHDAAEIYATKLRDYGNASLMFEKNGDLMRASEMAEKGGDIARAALLSDLADSLDRAASLYERARKYEKAADTYVRILQQLLSEKEEKGYLESFRARIARAGNSAGSLYLRLNQFQKAAECFEKGDNLSKAAESYLLAGDTEKAAEIHYRLQEYDKAYNLLITVGENCKNKELLADICFQHHHYEEAGEFYLMTGRLQMAAEAYERGENFYKAAMFFETLEDYARSAELYMKLNEQLKAAELYEKAKNFEYAAELYQSAGAHDKAIDCLVEAGKVIYAAKMLIARDQIQKSVSLLQQLSDDHDDYPEACILLGQLFTTMEMYSVAQQKFAEAINKQPLSRDNIATYYGLALAYEKAAQYSKAREVYEQIVAVDLQYKDALERLQKIKDSNLLDGVTTDSTPSSVRRVIGGRYELTEKIGQDSVGTVYKGYDIILGRPVLIRRLGPQDKNITRNILEQTRVVSHLNHSNILTIYDSGKEEDHYFICMEFIDGPTLRHFLSRGPLDVSEICELISQICLALAYAHKKGIVHTNLCPENIYVAPGNHIKIANFGIEARWERNSWVSKQYTSPEQLMGQKVDVRTDLYAVGIILYEMLYARPPFTGPDVELQHLKKVPAFPDTSPYPVPVFLLKIMQRCLFKDKQKRYATAEQILEELEVADIVPGMVLNHRYEIVKQLGSGGMGHVYQARDRDLDETVALKVLRAEISADPVIQKRFLREIKVARMITHPNVVKVFDIGKYKGNRYISMEYIDGISLDYWLRTTLPDLRSRLTVLAKIMQGVQAAHAQGVIHRDLKPQNVLLDTGLNPHVLDFGIARSSDGSDATSGQVMGSPKYMSPEQIQGKALDQRSDIYSLGVLMFYMFTGEEPFTGDDPRSIIMKHLTQPAPSMHRQGADVPDWLEKIVMRSLEKDPENRFSSLKELLDDLKKGYEYWTRTQDLN